MSALAMRFGVSIVVYGLTMVTSAHTPAQAQEYAAMQGVTSVQTAFDFRVGDPDVALGHLNLIHSMLDDPSMTISGQRPEMVVVLIGPSVNLVSSESAIAPDARDRIAEKISAMVADGVRFEICMTAAHAHNISAESIHPEVVQVGNGWISMIGYQHQGYAMIADF